MKHKENTKVETKGHSLDREYAVIKKKLKTLDENNKTPNNLTWVLIIGLILSMMVTGIEITRILNPGEVIDYKTINHAQQITVGTKENWDYVLTNINTDKQTYKTGENVSIITGLTLKEKVKGTVIYEILDSNNKTIYKFEEDKDLNTKDEKNILLTRNYKPGKYSARTTILTDTGYLLKGVTDFTIQKKSLVDNIWIINPLQMLMLVLFLINLILFQKRIRHEKKK